MNTFLSDWPLTSLQPFFILITEQDGGILSLLDFAGLLILLGILVLIFAIIGPRVRRIAVVEFFEPKKEKQTEKNRRLLGMWEQIALGLLGLFLLGFGIAWKVNPPGDNVTQELTCPPAENNGPSIRIRRIAKACGCSDSDFSEVQVDSSTFKIRGDWFNKQPTTELWTLLQDENGTVTDAVKIDDPLPGKRAWDGTLFGVEKGKPFVVSAMVLDANNAKALQDAINNGAPILKPKVARQLYQEIIVVHVDEINDNTSLCPFPKDAP